MKKQRKILITGFRGVGKKGVVGQVNLYVGKSAVCIRFVQNRFEESYHPTIETTYKKDVKIKDQEYTLNIIDAAGMDKFSFFQPQHSLGIDGYVIMYSIENKQSFDMIKLINDRIVYNTGNEKIPRIIVANKCDIQERRKISESEGRSLAEELGCEYIETSAKQNENIQQLFHNLLMSIEKQNYPDKKKECIIL